MMMCERLSPPFCTVHSRSSWSRSKCLHELSSLIVPSLADDMDDLLSDGKGPSVHLQSLVRFRRPATGVSGAESLSSSLLEESLLSPARGDFLGELSAEEAVLLMES